MPRHFYNFERKTTLNQGQLVPVMIREVIPNETYRHESTAFLRTQPLLAPVMHTCEVKIHHWYVPTRILWDNWEKFITGGPDGRDDSVPPVIDLGSTGAPVGSLANHLRIPVEGSQNAEVSALPFRAYAYIWNEFYRDQDLQDPLEFSTADGEDTTTPVDLQSACWDKDYFTSARPNTQKGDPVTIPLSGELPVKNDGASGTNIGVVSTAQGTQTRALAAGGSLLTQAGTITTDGLYADLDDAALLDINDLRLSVKLQVYRENMLRYGSRYIERLQQAFGVSPQDSRLQLPEYLAGGKQIIQFSEVLQTAEGTNPVGTMAGHGISVGKSNRYKRNFPEYGFVLTFLVIRPKPAYQQGLPKMYSRAVKEDYFQPELQHIGMQPILNKEIYLNHTTPDGVFGFQDRYDEYRHVYDEVAGEFSDSLDFWTMQRIFASDPALNSDFVKCEGVNRIFAFTNEDQFYARVVHKIQANSKIHKSGKPMVF